MWLRLSVSPWTPVGYACYIGGSRSLDARGGGGIASAVTRAYNGGSRSGAPAGSRGRALVRGSESEAP